MTIRFGSDKSRHLPNSDFARFRTVDDDVKQLSMPVLLMSGSRTTGVAQYTDDELERLLPESTTERVTFDATHMMWQQRPVECRNSVLRFIREAE